MKYNHWIFDMDGTLTDSMGIWDEVPFALLEQYGRTPKPDLRQVLLPLGMAESARYLIREYQLPLDEANYDAAVMEAVGRLYRTVELKPGVRKILERLKAEGAHLCVCSNTWQPMCERVLGGLGVLDYFDFVLSAQDGFTKKEPAIFLEAMRRVTWFTGFLIPPLGCLLYTEAVLLRGEAVGPAVVSTAAALLRVGGHTPAECVVCEDAVHAARTAHRAGFPVIGIADYYSRADEPEMRALSQQFLTSWEQLDWSKV